MFIKKFNLSVSLLLLFCLYFSGCASVGVRKLSNIMYTPVANPESIEIYYHGYNDVPYPYTVVAELTASSKRATNNATKLRTEAAKLGANAIVITGPKCKRYCTTWTSWIIKSEKTGWKALAIKYK